jgi:Monooxygenase subunit B protein
MKATKTKHEQQCLLNFIFIIGIISTVCFSNAQAFEGNVIDQSGVATLNTITFYDVNWSKDTFPVGDSMTITGKLHVFKNWSENITKPNAAVFRLKVQGEGAEPVFLQDITIGNQPAKATISLEKGKSYEFRAQLTARIPGLWAISPELVLSENTSITGPAKSISITGITANSPYPTPPNIVELLKQPATTNPQPIIFAPTIDVKVEQGSYAAADKTLSIKLAIKNQGKYSIRLGELNIASSRFLDPMVFQDDTRYPAELLMAEGLKSNDTSGTVKAGESGSYEAKVTGGVWENIYHLSSGKDKHLSFLLFFTNEMAERESIEVDVPLK